MSDESESEYDTEDDEDYVPGEASSEEDGEFETDEKKGKKKSKPVGRKRKGGIKLDEDDDEVSNHEESEEEEDAIDTTAKEKDDLASKQRVEELWAAFKQDTAVARSAGSSKVEENIAKKVNEASTSSAVQQEEKKVPKKVEVTEIFDFAGEEVKVVKLVDPSSVTPPASNEEDKTTVKPKTTLPVKRPGGGLGSILGKIGKKPKMSTLEKSKLDWNSFKKDEGIEDELKRSNRDGFLEKQAFLNRVDHKQFEIERDIRQGARKR